MHLSNSRNFSRIFLLFSSNLTTSRTSLKKKTSDFISKYSKKLISFISLVCSFWFFSERYKSFLATWLFNRSLNSLFPSQSSRKKATNLPKFNVTSLIIFLWERHCLPHKLIALIIHLMIIVFFLLFTVEFYNRHKIKQILALVVFCCIN